MVFKPTFELLFKLFLVTSAYVLVSAQHNETLCHSFVTRSSTDVVSLVLYEKQVTGEVNITYKNIYSFLKYNNSNDYFKQISMKHPQFNQFQIIQYSSDNFEMKCDNIYLYYYKWHIWVLNHVIGKWLYIIENMLQLPNILMYLAIYELSLIH